MPLPLAALGMSALGALLPPVVDAILGSRSKEEAEAALAPQRDRMMANLVAQGMSPEEATAQIDESLQGELMAKMQEGVMPGWMTMGASLAGGGLGALAGKALARGAGKLIAKEASGAAADAVQGAAKIAGRGETTVTDAAYARRMQDIKQANFDKAQTGAFNPRSGGDSGGQIIPYAREADEVIPPFRARRVEPTYPSATNSVDEIGYTPVGKIGYEPLVGSGPAPMPMSTQEEFRRFLASQTRSEPMSPPIYIKPPPRGLPYDPNADINLQMRMNPELF